jgi:spore maturation protein CgeB
MNDLLRSIKYKLVNFQKQIFHDLKPFLVQNSDFIDKDYWFTPSEDVYIYERDGGLYFTVDYPGEYFVSYMDTEYHADKIPSNQFTILPDETYEIKIKGTLMGEVEVQLVITEFSSTKRIKTSLIDVNHQVLFTPAEETRKIRIALKLSNVGVFQLEEMSFAIKEKSTPFLYLPNAAKQKDSITKLDQMKVACIFDEFSMTCFGKQVQLITFTPENWGEVLGENKPDVLMVESAWRGNFGAWEYKIAHYNNQDKTPLFELLKWCKRNGVPTIFWNKEDPIHFDKFIDTAKRFDFIYTTDENMIPKYKETAGHTNVFSMPFSAEPSLHNPIKLKDERIPKICFAGSYYGNRHAERRQDMEDMLDIALEFGLDIFDRNYEKNKHQKTPFSFPDRFQDCIRGSLRYDQIEEAYKGYKVMLNVNSVKESPTMFSRRVFEGLACGTPILSSYSYGVKKFFPGIVLISEDNQTLRNNLKRLMEDEVFYRSTSLEGIREVFLHHTYRHRLMDLFSNAGFHNLQEKNQEIAVVSVIRSREEFNEVLESFEKQAWGHKQLYLFLDLFDGYIDILNQYNNDTIHSYVLSYMDHYQRLQEVVTSSYITYMSPGHFYGDHYLTDLGIAIEYSGADIIGKASHFESSEDGSLVERNTGKEYEFVDHVMPETAVIHQKLLKGENIAKLLQKLEDGTALNGLFKKGARMFSSDKYNFVQSGKKGSAIANEQVNL